MQLPLLTYLHNSINLKCSPGHAPPMVQVSYTPQFRIYASYTPSLSPQWCKPHRHLHLSVQPMYLNFVPYTHLSSYQHKYTHMNSAEYAYNTLLCKSPTIVVIKPLKRKQCPHAVASTTTIIITLKPN